VEEPFRITPEARELLLKVSPATIDRKLKEDKKKLAFKGKCGTKPGNLLKKQITVRVYYADADKKPGFFEADTVHHCGTSESREFCITLTATDVYSGWVELRSLLNKAHKWVFIALLGIKFSLPFPFLGLDNDNGGEFINSALHKWCAEGGYSLPVQGPTARTTTVTSSRRTTPVSGTLSAMTASPPPPFEKANYD